MIFGVMRIINFAHGELYMLGAFGTYVLCTILKIPYLVGILVSAITVGAFGILLEKVFFSHVRSVRGKEELNSMILALGIAIVIQNSIALVFGPEDLSIASTFTNVLNVGKVFYPAERVFVAFFSFCVLVAIYVFIKFHKYGNALRAVVQDAEAAAIQGIKINRVYAMCFGIGSFLAAIAGGLLGPVFSISAFMGSWGLLKAFIIVILGGLGSFAGAIAGGFIIGFTDSIMGTFFGGAASNMLGFFVIILVLIFKPSGLLGSE
jgi:branched-chain amino acid transport system permease protein